MRFQGQKAIVTGSGGGIGRAIALKLASEGCDIGIFDLNEAQAKETAELVREKGRSAHVTIGSVAKPDDASRGANDLMSALGGIDILVNNAGLLRIAEFFETTVDDWRNSFGVNVDGAFWLCRAVLPRMVQQKSGRIVNVSSWCGKKGVANFSAYSASKFALIGLTQSLAAEFGNRGIRVNAVCPGIILDTQMRADAEEYTAARGLPNTETRAKAVPLQRGGHPHEVADVVAFLASSDSTYMTGQALNVTGGLCMH